ncbi:hypothetical protein [Rhodopseudomonas sp. B29]|nr:hypothetical protein [Rhodopseudomonas sp. B29]
MSRKTDKPPLDMPSGSVVDIALIAIGLAATLAGLAWLFLS